MKMNSALSRPGLVPVALAVALAVTLGVTPAWSAPLVPPVQPAAVLTPGQIAFMQAETRRIEEAFIQRVMVITGATRDQVVRAIPAKGRLTDRLARIYSSLERDLKAPLTDEQQGLIYAADGERKLALKDLPAQAAAK